MISPVLHKKCWKLLVFYTFSQAVRLVNILSKGFRFNSSTRKWDSKNRSTMIKRETKKRIFKKEKKAKRLDSFQNVFYCRGITWELQKWVNSAARKNHDSVWRDAGTKREKIQYEKRKMCTLSNKKWIATICGKLSVEYFELLQTIRRFFVALLYIQPKKKWIILKMNRGQQIN